MRLSTGSSRAVGVAAIIVLKLLGISQVFVTAAPVLVMLAYASLVIQPHYRARADQIGDNLYYLGFVFTLASLAFSLGQFNAHGNVDKIIGNFGIALFTTLAGVVLRVAFNQLRSDPIETEREARLQLAEAARKLKNELSGATAEFSMATRATRQSVADGVAEMQEMLAETLKGASELLRQSMVEASSKMTATSDELRGAIQSSGSKLSSATGRLSDAVDETAGHVRGSAMAMTEDHRTFTATGRKLVLSVERLSERVDAAIAPGDPIRVSLDATSRALGVLDAASLKAAEGLADASIKGAAIVASSLQVSEDARATARAALAQTEAVSEASRIVSAASEVVSAAEGHPDRIRIALEELEARLAQSSGRIAAELGAALAPGIAVGREASQIERLVERMDTLIDLMRERAAPTVVMPEHDPA